MKRRFSNVKFPSPSVTPNTSPSASPSSKSCPSPQKEDSPVVVPVVAASTKPIEKMEKPKTTQPPPMEAKGQPESKTSANTTEMKNFEKSTPIADSSGASNLKRVCSLTADDMVEMLARMGCLECHKIPSPFRLFQCPRGHLLCFDCGTKRFMKEDVGHISSGTCNQEMEKEEGSGSRSNSTRGIGYGLINPALKLADGEIEQLMKNMKTGKLECRLRIRESRGDPIYKAIYNNTLWNCPYQRFGCEEKLYGKDMHDHMVPCMKKLGLL